MPLDKSKSKGAFSRNVSAEMHAGKPQKQSLAIAYSIARKAGAKYAEGGDVDLPVMVDPLAGQRSIGERPDVQQALQSTARSVAEPFGQLGRVMMGKSDEPLKD